MQTPPNSLHGPSVHTEFFPIPLGGYIPIRSGRGTSGSIATLAFCPPLTLYVKDLSKID
ncbi:hypothetical protein HOLleu_43954 [Holothuria leucospilota]|uniref:Uncharacterized protein n=1 Tax=Holothuria leucospilota TaxID=206669 RepID=A0A9Q0YGE7_HOLLE|nr:hypothetical protein HOLleu_43954 [Holothuria leucospilota]